jgi:putative membrane protein
MGHVHRVHEGLGWGAWLLWILLTIAFWALVVMAVIWLVRSITGRGTAPAARHWTGGPGAGVQYGGPVARTAGPEEILAERYARGEIDEGEYRSRLAVLRGAAEGTPPGSAGTAGPPPA